METSLTKEIRAADSSAQYDAACKRVLSEKRILACIMKNCLEEYRDCTPQEIAERYIEGTPQVGKESVYPDESPRIHGMGNEDVTLQEGIVVYDVRFTALAPSTGDLIRLIINVEAQNQFYPGYPLVKRGLFYCSRLMSAQYGTKFTQGHYEKIKKVYSIWICSNPPQNRKNSIFRYRVAEDILAGDTKVREKKENYDLLTVLLLCLGDMGDETENSALDLLNILLSIKDDPDEKLQRLKEQFQIPITQGLDREVSLMCNLSKGIEDRGIQKGIQEGIQKGIQEGIQKGEILGAVKTCRSLKMPEKDILMKLQELFSLTAEEAKQYMATKSDDKQ